MKIRKSELILLTESANVVRNKILTVLSGTRHGRTYRVPGTKNAYYIASAPGEPPASPTGTTIKANVDQEIKGTKKGAEAAVGVKDEGDVGVVAITLEKGRRKMAPRPYILPSFQLTAGTIKRILSGRWF